MTAPSRLRQMNGRDPHEAHRSATPLELLFDLTFVVAFGVSGNELAHQLAEGHVAAGIAAFCFASFAICWAWINYSWMASAYDTDDWAFRLLTMVQMVGVIIMALGLPEMFESVHEGHRLHNEIVIAGYVVMRIALCGQWLRAWRQDPARRSAHRVYLATILIAQVLWCVIAVLPLSVPVAFAAMVVPLVIELTGPFLAERRFGGTPWHADHIAERYGLLTIITLGEGVIGTVAVMSAIVNEPDLGWSLGAVLLLAAGIGLTFGQWWTYFTIPWADMLERRRDRSFLWGYMHILVFASIAATGAGLHVAAYMLEGESGLSEVGVVLSVALPVGAFALVLYLLYNLFMRVLDPFHLLLLGLTAAVLIASVVMAIAGVPVAWCLVVVALAPVVTIVGYETVGHRHVVDHLDSL
ncbi:low temperature requirement protein A [Nocardioides albus]|uniref:Low temperature requirement protein LtrA n=1 Tax=Nocardioides albus TaxID=1841 RepID=A0A7W5A2F0_9ACTN|nr:low temperature requirement protein A [Nocardioides albus]MBB3088064.1 low temperature requirement protein LtrA [Nocardioides albus]GGU22338.1 membrane protein [Nocardioides albus]